MNEHLSEGPIRRREESRVRAKSEEAYLGPVLEGVVEQAASVPGVVSDLDDICGGPVARGIRIRHRKSR